MLKKYIHLFRAFGARWVLFRVRYALRQRLGLQKIFAPQKPWNALPAAFSETDGCETPAFTQTIGNPLNATLRNFLTTPPAPANTDAAANALAEANEILAGHFRLYGWRTHDAGRFPEWHRNALTGERAPATAHWSRLGDFAFGDIKNIWELSRWHWAFPLASAWLRTADNAYAERFWELAENWLQNNPPNSGPNWKCGQESSFRLFAATAARFALADAPATTANRIAAWQRLVRATGERITANLDYALSQSNNHGVSECVGLLTAGRLIGGKLGAKWAKLALRNLRQQVTALVYPDGGFSQHSAVYHRVLVHDLTWAILFAPNPETASHRPADAAPAPNLAPAWLQDALTRATDFLANISSPETHSAHLYGANDGANILPCPAAQFADFHPAIHLAHLAQNRHDAPARAKADANDDAASAAPPPAPPAATRHFPDSGVLLLKRAPVSLLLRCPTHFRHRATRDMGHLSLHWNGIPIFLNPGSYSYNTTGQFAAGFSSAFEHNTATCEDADQMEKLGRFLYLPWPKGKFRQLDVDSFEFTNLAYLARFGATHTRRIRFVTPPQTLNPSPTAETRRANPTLIIEDIFEAPAPRRWRLHWLLPENASRQNAADARAEPLSIAIPLPSPSTSPQTLRLSCHIQSDSNLPPEISAVRAAPDSVRGWYSPRYQEARPALSVAIALPATRKATIQTILKD